MKTWIKKSVLWPVRIIAGILSVLFILSVILVLTLQGVVVWLNSDSGTQWIEARIQEELNETPYSVAIHGFQLHGISGIGVKTLSLKHNDALVVSGENVGLSVNIFPIIMKNVSVNLAADRLAIISIPSSQGAEDESPFPIELPDLYFETLSFGTNIQRLELDQSIIGDAFTAHLQSQHSFLLGDEAIAAKGLIRLQDVQYPNAQYLPHRLEHAVDFDYKTGRLDIKEFEALNALYRLDSQGDYDLSSDAYKADIALVLDDPADILHDSISQPLRLEVVIEGTDKAFKGDLQAVSAIKDHALSLQSSLSFDGQNVSLSKLEGAMDGTALSGDLAMDISSSLVNGQIKAALQDFAVVESFVGDIPVAGHGEAHVKFLASSPETQGIDMQAALFDLVYDEAKAETVKLSLEIKDLKETEALKVRTTAHNLIYKTSRFESLNVDVTLLDKGFDLMVKGNGFDGHPFSVSGDMAIQDIKNLDLDIRQASINMANGALKASGQIKQEALSINVSMKDIDPAKIPALNLGTIPLKLKDGSARLTGTLQSPILQSNLNWNATLEEIGKASLITDVTYRDNALKIALTGQGKGIQTLDGEVGIPMTLALQPFTADISKQTALSGHIKSDVVLGEITEALLAETGLQIEGRVQADAKISGTLAAPAIDGFAHLKDGLFYDPATNTQIKKISAEAIFKNNEVTLSNLSARDEGNGILKANGSLSFADIQSPDMNFELALDSMNLLQSQLVNADIDADLSFKNKGARYILSGNITPEEVMIELPDRFNQSIPQLNIVEKDDRASESFGKRVDLDVAFDAQHRIFVRGWGLDTELGGKLIIGGTADEPDIQGNLSSLRGRYEEFGKKFDISRAVLRFQGKVPPSPYLDILTQTQTEDVTVNIAITGRAEQPKLSLSSIPSLPEDEILSRILFGRDSSKISPFQAVQLAQTIRRFSGRSSGPDFDPLGTLRSVTGLDDITVEGVGTEDATVGAGKYVSDKVYVEIEQGSAADSGAASVEVEVTPNISVESKAGRNGSAGAGVFWEWDY